MKKFGVSTQVYREIMSFSRDDTYQWNCTSTTGVKLVQNSWQQEEHVYSHDEYIWKHVLVELFELWTSMTCANWFRNGLQGRYISQHKKNHTKKGRQKSDFASQAGRTFRPAYNSPAPVAVYSVDSAHARISRPNFKAFETSTIAEVDEWAESVFLFAILAESSDSPIWQCKWQCSSRQWLSVTSNY